MPKLSYNFRVTSKWTICYRFGRLLRVLGCLDLSHDWIPGTLVQTKIEKSLKSPKRNIFNFGDNIQSRWLQLQPVPYSCNSLLSLFH